MKQRHAHSHLKLTLCLSASSLEVIAESFSFLALLGEDINLVAPLLDNLHNITHLFVAFYDLLTHDVRSSQSRILSVSHYAQVHLRFECRLSTAGMLDVHVADCLNASDLQQFWQLAVSCGNPHSKLLNEQVLR